MQKSIDLQGQLRANKRLKLIRDISLFASGGDKKDIEDKFSVFVTAHLAKSKQADIEYHCKHFRNVFDRAILGQRRRLYKILSIERGAEQYNQFHAHWLMELPVFMSLSKFETKFTELWIDICGSSNIEFKVIENELGGINGLIHYCTKEVSYGNYGTFNELCSDNARNQNNRHSLGQLMALTWQRNDKSNAITSN
jgi:hypothetical protein